DRLEDVAHRALDPDLVDHRDQGHHVLGVAHDVVLPTPPGPGTGPGPLAPLRLDTSDAAAAAARPVPEPVNGCTGAKICCTWSRSTVSSRKSSSESRSRTDRLVSRISRATRWAPSTNRRTSASIRDATSSE